MGTIKSMNVSGLASLSTSSQNLGGIWGIVLFIPLICNSNERLKVPLASVRVKSLRMFSSFVGVGGPCAINAGVKHTNSRNDIAARRYFLISQHSSLRMIKRRPQAGLLIG